MKTVPYEFAVRQFRDLPSEIRLVVLHPGYRQQHTLLNPLLDSPGTVYVRFEGHNLSRAQLGQQLDLAIAAQVGGKSLNEVGTLVMDECDRSSTGEFDIFVSDLVSGSGPERLVIISRDVPRCVMVSDILRNQTRFVPAEDSLMLWDYARQDNASALLEVRALGTGRILLHGQSIDNWDGVLPRSLFFYLIDRGMTTRSEIFETFWPTLSTREATNVFHVTKRKISEVLGMDLTVYWSGFYRISPDIKLSYDAALFSEMIQDSEVATTEQAQYLLERAISLYRCNFLTSVDMDWVTKRRKELLETYGEALISLAKMVEKAGDLPRALGLYLRAAMTNPQREDLARSIMSLYRDLGMHRDAIYTYERLESQLETNLGVSPAPQLQDLRDSILAETREKVVR